MKNIIIAFFLITSVFEIGIGKNCHAGELEIQFGGFAFRGDFIHIQSNYPHVYEISKKKMENGQGLLEKLLLDRIKEIQLNGARLVFEKQASLGEGALVLACCIDNEMVTIERIQGYKTVIDLGAQILLFDYEQMRLVASYPFDIQLINFFETEPNEDIIHEQILALLLTNKYRINLLDDFANLLSKIEFKKSYGSTLKVTNVIIEEKVFPFLPDRFRDNLNNFETFVAQSFGKFISKNQRVSILPYTKGYDIGSKMAIRFSDAKVFQLQIPEPQYAITIKVRGFKKVQTDSTVACSSWVYGAFTEILMEQPLLGKIYLNEQIKNGVIKKIPADQQTFEEWPIFQESLLVLFDKLSKNFSEERKYNGVKEVIEKCR